MTGQITVAAVDKRELAAAFDGLAAQPQMTWRELLIAVTDQLRHAPPEALDAPVQVQLPGGVGPLESVEFDPDAAALLLVPWLVTR